MAADLKCPKCGNKDQGLFIPDGEVVMCVAGGEGWTCQNVWRLDPPGEPAGPAEDPKEKTVTKPMSKTKRTYLELGKDDGGFTASELMALTGSRTKGPVVRSIKKGVEDGLLEKTDQVREGDEVFRCTNEAPEAVAEPEGKPKRKRAKRANTGPQTAQHDPFPGRVAFRLQGAIFDLRLIIRDWKDDGPSEALEAIVARLDAIKEESAQKAGL